jgi:outer membrane protein assembly factor BamB
LVVWPGAIEYPAGRLVSLGACRELDEQLSLPLRLALRISVDDAILTSPAVVGGRAYVVDQSGTAYSIDVTNGSVVWKTMPAGASAVGGNTSSPCVVDGHVFS